MPLFRSATIFVMMSLAPCVHAPAGWACDGSAQATAKENSPIVPHSVMMAALLDLRSRFPNQIVIGFEEIFSPPPDSEPQIDLGPPDVTLQGALQRIRALDDRYKVELLHGELVFVHPRRPGVDPAGLLNIRLHKFTVPPDSCLQQQMCCYMTSAGSSYTPELGRYLQRKQQEWYRREGKEPEGIVGDFLGDCDPQQHDGPPFYHNITVREALTLMSMRSLHVARGHSPNMKSNFRPKPISWRYRFRPDPNSDTGLGGVPVFQIF